MGSQTTHYGFEKQNLNDIPDLTVFNENWDIIDEQLYQISQSVNATGSYTGNGGTLNINIGFRPSLVVVFCQYTETDVGTYVIFNNGIFFAPDIYNENDYWKLYSGAECPVLGTNGFSVYYFTNVSSDPSYIPSLLNKENCSYRYIAFK